jgi:RNA polymerase sigma-70 factor (ECF subfamily)
MTGCPTGVEGLRPAGTPEELRTVEALRAGDEQAFVEVVRRYSPTMMRVALLYVSSPAVADEVVQEAWKGVISGIGRFEGRSTLRTWLFRVLTDIAKTRGERERRSVPYSALVAGELDADEPAVEPDRFLKSASRWPDFWFSSPRRWRELPEACLLSQQTRELLKHAVDSLPAVQRAVIVLRDIEGWRAQEVCELLGVTEGHQRVLLHRARAKARRALEEHLDQA